MRLFPLPLLFLAIVSLVLLPLGCFRGAHPMQSSDPSVLRLATTTSTRDTGLLEVLVAVFEKKHNVRVDVVAVGTGAALKLGEAGDADAVLVHAREAEEAFMAAGHGVRREDVMYNMFEILGPANDPAGIHALDPAAALQRIAAQGETFVSRGDDSGTHKRERKLWADGSGRPQWDGYIESGRGMGATLIMADQMSAYTLSDRGTYLTFQDKIRLVPLVKSSNSLRNPYGIVVVNPKKHSGVNGPLAREFVDFMISTEAQLLIRDYEVDGERLFHPLRLPDQN